MVNLAVDISEKKIKGKYFYQLHLYKNGVSIYRNMCKQIEVLYNGSRFPRRKEILLSFSSELKKINEPEFGFSGGIFNVGQEERGLFDGEG